MWRFSFAQQFTNYTTKDGLPSNHVYTIVQDAKGFMWFLTDKGMARYNGNQLKTFTTKNGLPNNDVWEAFPTTDGKVWYMSKSTKLGYIENDTVISFPNSNKDEIINPIYSSQVGDSIYPTGPRNTFTLKDDKWYGEKNKYVKNLKEDWIKIRHKHVGYISLNQSDQTLYLYNKELEKLNSIPTKNIYGVTGVRGQLNDSLFFWTNDKAYSILNFNTQIFKQFKLNKNIENVLMVQPRINIADNELQISGNGFVAKLDKDLKIFNPFYFPKELRAHFGFIDRSNTVWLATFNNGVYKFPYAKRDVQYKLQNEKIQSFNTIDDSLVVGVYKKGIYKYNPKEKSFKQFIKSNDYVFGVSQVKELNTNFYLLKNSLFKEFNGKREGVDLSKLYDKKITSNEVGRKFIYFNEKLYGNFSFGINRLNPNPFVIEKEYTQKGCNDIIRFNNQLLVATTNGLKEIKGDLLVPVVFNNRAFKKSILSLNVIDDTRLLINTDGFGSYITNMQTLEPLKETEFLIVEEAFKEGANLWLATNSGVLKFKKSNKTYKLSKTYTISDGLPTNHINTLYVDDKNLIVGTNNGIAIVPKTTKSISQFLDVFIEKAKYNNERITESNSTFKYRENNNVSFTVSNIDFSNNHSNFSYDYKLEPLQKEWTNSKINSFNFNDLQPGKYTFNVKSNNLKKTLDFTVKPLLYQRLSFKILSFLLIVFLIVYLSKFFIKRAQFKKNKKIFEDKRLSELQLKALRSQMNPHFVFNSLAAIQYYINDNDFEASETYLVKFSKLIRQFFELSKENEIALRTEVNLLKSYLEIEKLRFKEKLNFIINVDSMLDIDKVKIPTMLLQPIVENAVNHGVFNKEDEGLITLNFIFIDDHAFKVEIIDDGVGFVNTKKRQSMKIKSSSVLKDRLRFLNHSEKWVITYSKEEVSPEKEDKGNKSIFIIKHRN
ncbi:histidine kinase [Lacinutrix sp. Bg11-31]|uniref:sensor histidine kinase n=1 Tax=Lacinutrix sp. Bg11-31 TaxID=2057808 RepID=UPI000C30FDF5|nr:histidine kinase [Lacinutrix sp. Bg11-31]AUC81848.1 hypothetical protein CW733_06760 [Lacinutrix sp. Bg11-31]